MSELLICMFNCRDCAELCEICIRGLERGARVARRLCLACAAACELCVAAFYVRYEASRAGDVPGGMLPLRRRVPQTDG